VVAWPKSAPAGSAPADLIWHFRIDSLLQTALLWLVLWLVMSVVLERQSRPAGRRRSDAEESRPFVPGQTLS
jgi:predicted cobalt transporter CbtA